MVDLLKHGLSLLFLEADGLFLDLQFGSEVANLALHRGDISVLDGLGRLRWTADLRGVLVGSPEAQLLALVMVQLVLHRVDPTFVVFDLLIQILQPLLVVCLALLFSESCHLDLVLEDFKLVLVIADFSLGVFDLKFELVVGLGQLLLNRLGEVGLVLGGTLVHEVQLVVDVLRPQEVLGHQIGMHRLRGRNSVELGVHFFDPVIQGLQLVRKHGLST